MPQDPLQPPPRPATGLQQSADQRERHPGHGSILGNDESGFDHDGDWVRGADGESLACFVGVCRFEGCEDLECGCAEGGGELDRV